MRVKDGILRGCRQNVGLNIRLQSVIPSRGCPFGPRNLPRLEKILRLRPQNDDLQAVRHPHVFGGTIEVTELLPDSGSNVVRCSGVTGMREIARSPGAVQNFLTRARFLASG